MLPVEVQTGKFLSAQGEEMKKSVWIMHVPTSLQDQVLQYANSGEKFVIEPTSLLNVGDAVDGQEEDEGVKVDYQVGLENANVMVSISGGKERGTDVEFDETLMKIFEGAERREYSYKRVPKRRIACVDIKGDPTPESISKVVSEIKTALTSSKIAQVLGRNVKPKIIDVDESLGETSDSSPKIGFLLKSCKSGFNRNAEPAIAVYEMQYGFRTTSVYLEVDC